MDFVAKLDGGSERDMRFSLIDRITDLQPGVRITAVKSLSLAEEYLMDHFPQFPVMPGVLMLEAMYQTSAWLVRYSEDFAHSVVVLSQAKGVKYSGFVEPGQTLNLSAVITKQDERYTSLKAQGMVEDNKVVSAKLVLSRYNLGEEREPHTSGIDQFNSAFNDDYDDQYAQSELKRLFDILYQPGSSIPSATQDT